MDGGEDSGRAFRKRFEMEQRMRVEHWCFGGKISMRGLGFGIWGFFKWGVWLSRIFGGERKAYSVSFIYRKNHNNGYNSNQLERLSLSHFHFH